MRFVWISSAVGFKSSRRTRAMHNMICTRLCDAAVSSERGRPGGAPERSRIGPGRRHFRSGFALCRIAKSLWVERARFRALRCRPTPLRQAVDSGLDLGGASGTIIGARRQNTALCTGALCVSQGIGNWATESRPRCGLTIPETQITDLMWKTGELAEGGGFEPPIGL